MERQCEESGMTYREAYEQGVKELKGHGVPDADLDAFYLLEHASGGRLSRAKYLACREDPIDGTLFGSYLALLALRGKRIPLQQITGSQESGSVYRIRLHYHQPEETVSGDPGICLRAFR